VKVVDGHTIVNTASKKHTSAYMITHLCSPGDKKERSPRYILGKVDVVDQMVELKNQKRRGLVGAKHEGTGRGKQQYRKKCIVKKVPGLPEAVTIDVADVRGLSMEVVLTPASGKGSGIWMELLPVSLNYVCEEIAAQFHAGGSSGKTAKRNSKGPAK